MQAVVVSRTILEQQWRRPRLSGRVAALEKRAVLGRIAYVEAHGFVPAIGNAGQWRIERSPKLGDESGQGSGEVFCTRRARTRAAP